MASKHPYPDEWVPGNDPTLDYAIEKAIDRLPRVGDTLSGVGALVALAVLGHWYALGGLLAAGFVVNYLTRRWARSYIYSNPGKVKINR